MKKLIMLAMLAMILGLAPQAVFAQSQEDCAYMFPYDYDAQYFCYLFGPPAPPPLYPEVSSPGMLPPPGGPSPGQQYPGYCPPNTTPPQPDPILVVVPFPGISYQRYPTLHQYVDGNGCPYSVWQFDTAALEKRPQIGPIVPPLWMDEVYPAALTLV